MTSGSAPCRSEQRACFALSTVLISRHRWLWRAFQTPDEVCAEPEKCESGLGQLQGRLRPVWAPDVGIFSAPPCRWPGCVGCPLFGVLGSREEGLSQMWEKHNCRIWW